MCLGAYGTLSGSGVPPSTRGDARRVRAKHVLLSVGLCSGSAPCSAPLACALGSQPIPMGSARRLVVLGAFAHPVPLYVQGTAKALHSAGCARPVSRSGSVLHFVETFLMARWPCLGSLP